MKRKHQDRAATGHGGRSLGNPGKPESTVSQMAGKGNVLDEEQDAGGMDKLLAVLGYNVTSSEMADVAQQLEQLEKVMVSAQEDGVSHLSDDTVHRNPSDLSSWLQNMLSEFNLPLNTLDSLHIRNEHPVFVPSEAFPAINGGFDDSEFDLRAIPGGAICPPIDSSRKRLKTSLVSDSSSSLSFDQSRPIVLVDLQETGVRLVHTLMACAEAVQEDNMKLAGALVKHIRMLAGSQAGAMGKVATYFAEALARRIYRIYRQDCPDPSYTDLLQMHFYEACPYLKFAHFTANQAILEAFTTASRVHVIDFGLKQGMQWPALMQALALRSGGPPAFRLTGIGPPQPDNTDALQQVGWKLAQFADSIGIKFEFRGFLCNSLADLEPEILDIGPPESETVAVNSVFELHRVFSLPSAIDKVLSSMKRMKPKIVTMVEQEANHNGPVFLDRFTEALHYYSSLFDSLEGSSAPPSQYLVMSELYLGRQICDVVACEGPDRVERHETLTQWRSRMGSAGFDPVHLGSNAFNQASTLLNLFAGGDGYRVEENNGCLTLGWHTRPLIATSAWKLAAGEIQ